MRPVLFKLGDYPFYGYSTMMFLAIIIGITAALFAAKKKGIKPRLLLEGAIFTVIVGLIGARLLYVALTWDYFSVHPEKIFLLSMTGLSYYGAFLGGALAVWLWCRWRKLNYWQMADLMSPYLILGYAIVRIGCLLSGCCYGKVSGVYWAVVIPRVDSLFRHPVQLYASFGAFLIFAFLKIIEPIRPFPGFNLVALGSLYGVLRFSTEFFREGTALWLGLTGAQWFSLFLAVISTTMIYYLTKRAKSAKAKSGKKKSQSQRL